MLLWQDPAADQEAADFQEVASAAEDAAQAAASQAAEAFQAAEAASEVAHSAEARDPQAEALAAALITHHPHHIITDPITADGITVPFLSATAEAAQAAA